MRWFKRKKKSFKDTPANRAYRERTRAALAGFLAGDEAAARTLVELVTPLVYKWLDWRHEELMHEWRELQARAFLVLVEWRHQKRLKAEEPLPFLVRRIMKQVVRAYRGQEARQEKVAQAWVLEPRPAPVKADQLLDAARFEERVWALAREKMSPAAVEALAAGVLEETLGVDRSGARKRAALARAEITRLVREGKRLDAVRWAGGDETVDSAPGTLEAMLGTNRVAARKRVVRARAEITRLAREAGLLDDLHWEGQGEAVVTEPLLDDEAGGD